MLRGLRGLFRFSGQGKKTALYDLHKAHKGRMIEFAGYELPVLYEDMGVLKQHMWCRQHAALFDVSHMGQIRLTGEDRLKFIQRISVGDIKDKRKGDIFQSYLSLILNPQAGIIDDTIITNIPTKNIVHMVVNGANKHKVIQHFIEVRKNQNFKVDFSLDETRSLICLQGPQAAKVITEVFGFPTQQIPFMSQFEFKNLTYQTPLFISRSGYTGEDGFEISFESKYVDKILGAMLKSPEVKWAGLGARDSLRIEAGLCLHGHDISDKTTPFEGTLMWTVSKKKEGRVPFIGQQALEKQVADNKAKKNKVQKRVGFIVQKSGIVREGAPVKDASGNEVGHVTSGTYSPVLKKGVGMMYVNQNLTKEGTDLTALVRDKPNEIKVAKMPFIEVGYNRLWDKV